MRIIILSNLVELGVMNHAPTNCYDVGRVYSLSITMPLAMPPPSQTVCKP